MASATSHSHPLLKASSAAYGILALLHTMKGLDQFKHPTMRTLPLMLRGASKIGWYEGSGFFVIMSILNYKWSQTGVYDVYDKGIAGILVGMMAAAGGAYWTSNDKPTAMALGFVAVLQALGVRNGWYDRLA
ncbi:hypothetical protein P3342_001053 [Pyrenophora teres f. teres]|uniref:Uncharacterized protein n=1 Tax=Pyrenophora teres f. teres TaxID=97479 RepID=A0A6S6VGZ5_9PLEO|nr:hypothetical protein HRS9122_10408 [Pyrenophora teres f. teres]KAE8835868.1 hypothetical protein HRS9139_03966 [Pyrenophora teres f. teres]KAE8838158.1 hypothetical protein PTNB85_05493 [Pyrenophora teres f. teres]KAE8862986.1 hypothetical protein PTNB29_05548 [Pyrenophora teres f. teres]KAE8868782.1 hypothetical protein PTNB73_03835 [Pyrenophora teres f. teres]